MYKASSGRFPWETEGQQTNHNTDPPPRLSSNPSKAHEDDQHHGIPTKISCCLDCSVLALARTGEAIEAIMSEPAITLQLSPKGVTAGVILRHAIGKFKRLHARLSPMSYKFGFTHCPRFRWRNTLYGYAHGREKYEAMVIFYAAADSQGPAFLEAALINLYEGFLDFRLFHHSGLQVFLNVH